MHGLSEQQEIDYWRAQYERVKTDRDALTAVHSKVNDAIGRAGIHCAITFWEAIDQIAAERDAARAELAKMRPVFDAAVKWRQWWGTHAEGIGAADLVTAIDSATKGPADE